jgi:hypothetical protein
MTTADIAALPVAEKLKLMETLWDSLCGQTDERPPQPTWHKEVLAERLSRIASGVETISPWREAKQRIRDQIKAG